VWKTLRREWLPLFCLAWFVIVLGPVLPLRDHVSGYYLTVPAIGLGLLLASAAVDAWRRGWLARGLSVALIGLYAWSSATYSWRSTLWQRERSTVIRNLIGGIVKARELHANELIVLAHVPADGFWAGLAHKPLRLLGIRDVYLAPEAVGELGVNAAIGDVRDFVIPKAVLNRAILNHTAVVYDASGSPLRSITTEYGRKLMAESVGNFPDRVEPGNPIFAASVGEGWFAPEYSYRWMSKRATLKLAAPNSAAAKLHLSGYAPREIFDAGALPLHVRVAGDEAGTIVLRRGDESFERDLPLPPGLTGKSDLSIEIECERTFRPANDSRDLCVAVTNVAIR